MPDQIMIEVAYALPDRQMIIPVLVKNGITVKEAIELSGVMTKFEGINLESDPVGIFGKLPRWITSFETVIGLKSIAPFSPTLKKFVVKGPPRARI